MVPAFVIHDSRLLDECPISMYNDSLRASQIILRLSVNCVHYFCILLNMSCVVHPITLYFKPFRETQKSSSTSHVMADVQVCSQGAALIPHCFSLPLSSLPFPLSNSLPWVFLDSFQSSLTCEDPWLTHKYGNLHMPKADSINTFVDENLKRKKVRTPQG